MAKLCNTSGRGSSATTTRGDGDAITVSPLIGRYKPNAALEEGGWQLDDDLSVYGQLVVLLNF